jgi:hypothetical protein
LTRAPLSARPAAGLRPRALAALGVPRAVAHDLDPGSAGVDLALGLAPPAMWVLVVILTRAETPFETLLTIGVIYGLLLALTHQVLWLEAFDGEPPRLGGNLADAPDSIHVALTRTGAVFSSLASGALTGAIGTALVAANERSE